MFKKYVQSKETKIQQLKGRRDKVSVTSGKRNCTVCGCLAKQEHFCKVLKSEYKSKSTGVCNKGKKTDER